MSPSRKSNMPIRRRSKFTHPALRNRRAADALRTTLDILASVDRRRAMCVIEAVSSLVTFAYSQEEL